MNRRCPNCASLHQIPLGFSHLRCNLCGIATPLVDGSGKADAFQLRDECDLPNWNNLLFRSTGRGLIVNQMMFSVGSVQILALRLGLRVKAIGTTLFGLMLPFKYGSRIVAKFEPYVTDLECSLSLGIMAGVNTVSDVIELCNSMEKVVSEIVVAFDLEEVDSELEHSVKQNSPCPTKVLFRKLNGNFAEQRNAIQAASSSGWVLQLDTDERLTSAAKRRLPMLIEAAEANGWHGIGLPRRNIVDGVVSAHYPDIQYRLLRQSVRYTRPVHEYAALKPHRTTIALGADIEHRMNSPRLAEREVVYETMMAGAGRPHDTALLRQALPREWLDQ